MHACFLVLLSKSEKYSISIIEGRIQTLIVSTNRLNYNKHAAISNYIFVLLYMYKYIAQEL